jgi:predicted transcriptional regulator
MNGISESDLSRRERQIMDAVYRLGRATAQQIRESIPSPPTYAAVRRMVAILEEKGYLRHDEEGARYVYYPTVDRERAGSSALRHVTRTFFDGSPAQAVAALLDASASELTDDEIARLGELVDKVRKEGR